MPSIEDFYAARLHMVEALRADLIGTDADEVITEDPYNRFVTGILYPQEADATVEASQERETSEAERTRMSPDSDEVPEQQENSDAAVALSHVRRPSACAMSFSIPEETHSLRVHVEAARYHDRGGQWHRDPIDADLELPVASDPASITTPVCEGLALRIVTRQSGLGVRAVTVALVNELTAPVQGKRDGHAWYQVGFRIECSEGFADRPTAVSTGLDDDDVKSGRLLFRNARNVAVGHGCATEWDDAEKITSISTTFLPRHDVQRADTDIAGVTLPMARFAEGSDHRDLLDLVERYRAWITDRRRETAALEAELQVQALEHLDRADQAADRMEAGLELLQRDALALRAFQLMNRAMREQRERQEMIRNGDPRREQQWRPFQIAFILMNLPGLTDPRSAERDAVDLLWFPTGGGKTEAYLGLVAYSILLRRLRNPRHGGVSVLMRYTLRLLTLQQFERAAGLICALEVVRRRELPEVQEPITLGLWVGSAATPNDLQSARKALSKLARGEDIQNENPMQLTRCPWCGKGLRPQNYVVTPTTMVIRCPDTECEFHTGIPAHVVDEDVYNVRPSLVIGTVDKFAMMAWNEKAQSLFSTDGLHPRPDLIVQDELHLISGPLGTMVGLYETAVEAACSQDGTRPKVVASTATIRRATDQVGRVFARETRQFPPPGLESGDSFFSVDAPADRMGTRQYVGVLGQGSSHTYVMVRVYAALLQAASSLEDPAVRDAYWTLMGYFNSLRVLGGAAIQVTDDVPAQMRVIAGRTGEDQREIAEPSELTSRIPSSEVPHRLQELAEFGDRALDVVLATNMISVGLDVDRLGLMAVMGQPQATAEYIQATSRVGRRNPGLVVVIYNGARSRDLSHYEGFAGFHRALYRQVEPNSATPFSPRARDRGLHGCLVATARAMVPELRSDDSPGRLSDAPGLLKPVVDLILARVGGVSEDQLEATAAQLSLLVGNWAAAADGTLKRYPGWYAGRDGALLVPVDPTSGEAEPIFPVSDAPWGTLTSLRDVDAESSLFLINERWS